MYKFLLVGVILMQRSEGGGLAGGGNPSGLMSARGAADFLTRATTVLATFFILLSIVLAGIATYNRAPTELDTSLARQPVAPAPLAPTVPLAGEQPTTAPAPVTAPAPTSIPLGAGGQPKAGQQPVRATTPALKPKAVVTPKVDVAPKTVAPPPVITTTTPVPATNQSAPQ
jgi:preprotein translocase subunit SecG